MPRWAKKLCIKTGIRLEPRNWSQTGERMVKISHRQDKLWNTMLDTSKHFPQTLKNMKLSKSKFQTKPHWTYQVTNFDQESFKINRKQPLVEAWKKTNNNFTLKLPNEFSNEYFEQSHILKTNNTITSQGMKH